MSEDIAARTPWRRHELLRVMPSAWAAALATRSLGQHPMLSGWADRGWPVIVRRRIYSDGTMVPVGVPLPPASAKARVALALPDDAVIARTPLPYLRTLAAAPPRWQPTIAGLLALGERHAVEPAVFGSLLWQHFTGLPYLSAGSDLDLVWPVHRGHALGLLLDGIDGIERSAPIRIDGEIVFADGAAANWRELRQALSRHGPTGVLVKTIDGARFVQVTSLPGCEQIQ
jgi:phosphoribosyl-dephospho-CoA transferase